MRKKIVAGNWKMNTSFEEGMTLVREICDVAGKEPVNDHLLIIIPPFIHLRQAAELMKHAPSIRLGAQNCHWEAKGAFTGEISLPMLRSIGVTHVLIGHSERRHYFKETGDMLLKKLHAAL